MRAKSLFPETSNEGAMKKDNQAARQTICVP
jgi:hypothetical protein